MALGGVAPHALAYLRTLAQRAKGKGARDRTRYSKARSGTKSFLTHHLRRVSKAAVVHDAMAIRKQITASSSRRSAASRMRRVRARSRRNADLVA